MKKLISIACAVLFVCLAFAACGKAEPDAFVPIDVKNVSTSGGSGKETGAEKGVKVAEIFNTLEVTGAFDEKAECEWSFSVISAGASPIIHSFEYLGDNVFNVSVDAGGEKSKFQVTSADLVAAIEAD